MLAVIFAVLYSASVTALCGITSKLPTLIHVENSIYDRIQSGNTLKKANLNQFHRQQFNRELAKVWLINLDEDINAGLGGGLNKLKLSHLLGLVGDIQSAKAVYLDYIYEIPSSDGTDDIILCRNIANLGDRLVMPFAYSLNRSGSYFSYLQSSAVSCQTNIICTNVNAGYTLAEPLTGDPAGRYLRLQMPSRGSASCAYLLAQRTHPHIAPRVASEIENGQMEINFACDNPGDNSAGIYHLTDASRLLTKGSLALPLIRATGPELILIGRFREQTGAGCRTLDTHPTPIGPELFGSTITLNAWLNIVSEGYLKRSSSEFLFFFNFLLGMLGGLWVSRFTAGELKSFWVKVLEFAGTAGLFFAAIMLLYLQWNIKLGFAIPLLAFIRCEYLARLFYQYIIPSKGGTQS